MWEWLQKLLFPKGKKTKNKNSKKVINNGRYIKRC